MASPRNRQRSRSSWSALLAAVLGALASVSTLGFSPTFAGGLSVAERGADVRATSKAASLRQDLFDPSLRLGGPSDGDPAVDPRDNEADAWACALRSLPAPSVRVLPVSVERVRDGRTRAPPAA
ncbi:hypothetical protein [Hyphomicrobium sp. CS1GBMeth3]|uniref:hypothetical protein n=1 Tax=Hyphomicrobium sp. CS1GBMeth3 TaxID=1892845 RepID=UPI000A96280F|nr:hypothetical protein [Hyphomicrobium sp. CS1GBMeth3]